MANYLVIAGDPSGDIHAANLIREIKKRDSEARFTGIGGPEMRKAGLDSIIPMKQVSVVGFWEVAKKYFFFKGLINQIKSILDSGNIDKFIPVDYPGFNIRIATHAKKVNVPVDYYIAPQLWAWGKNRAAKLRGAVDRLLVAFPFEEEYFGKFGLNTEFVGHPLLDLPEFANPTKGYHQREKIIAILPGSRRQEVIKHAPLVSGIIEEVNRNLPGFKIGIAKSSNIDETDYERYLNLKNTILFENSRELISISIAGAVKTGTSNLEAALAGMPFAMFYKTSLFTYQMGKSLINLPYLSIVNILENKVLVKEFIQSDARPENIFGEIRKIATDEGYFEKYRENFAKIRQMLGSSGAAARAAEIITGS